MKNQGKTFSIYANSGGCPQNQIDGSHLYNYLVVNGYSYTTSLEKADLIVINSCAYKSEKEEQSLAAYQSAVKRAKRDARIVFSGCLPKIAPDRLQGVDSNTIVIPGSELKTMESVVFPDRVSWDGTSTNAIPAPVLTYVKPFRQLLRSALNACRTVLPYEAARHFDRLFMYDHSKDTFVVRVATGCLGTCTYCAIRFSRGRLESRPLPEIMQDIKRAVNLNVNEILLSATDLAAFGRDCGLDLSILLQKVLDIAEKQYLLLFYANPRWMTDIWAKLESLFATQRIHFIHLSLNGGSDHVLQQMRRGYSIRDFEILVRSIKRVSPATVLQTQVITGFPGETEDDFDQTVRFLNENYFHNVQIHAFDPRPGTAAAVMPDQVPVHIRQQRRRRLYRLTLLRKMNYDIRYLANGFNPPID